MRKGEVKLKQKNYFFITSLIVLLTILFGKSSVGLAKDMENTIPAPPTSIANISDVFVIPSLKDNTNSAYVNENYPQSVTLTENQYQKFGVMWSKNEIDLRYNFTYQSYVYLGGNNDAKKADGLALVFQNDPKGTEAYGVAGYGIGVYSDGQVGVKNGFVIEMDPFLNTYKGSDSKYKVEAGINYPGDGDYNNNYEGHVAAVVTNDTGDKEGTQYHLNPLYGTSSNPVSNSQWTKLDVRWDAGSQTMYWQYGDYSEQSYKINDLTHVFDGQKVRFGFTASTGESKESNLVSIDKLPFPDPSINKTIVLSDGTNVKENESKIGDTVSFKIRNENSSVGQELINPKIVDALPSNYEKPTNVRVNYNTTPLKEGKANANSNGEYYEWNETDHTLTVYSKSIVASGGQDILYDTKILSGNNKDKLVNTATLTADNYVGSLNSNATTEITIPNKLTVEKTASPGTVKVGDTVHYRVIGYASAPTDESWPFRFEDTLPEGMDKPVNIADPMGPLTEGKDYTWDDSNRQLIVFPRTIVAGMVFLEYDSKVLSGRNGDKKINTVQFSSSDSQDKPIASATVNIKSLTLHVKQEVVNQNNQVVVPTNGAIQLNNVGLTDPKSINESYGMTIPSYEADTNQAFKTVTLVWNEVYQGYIPELSIPEFYMYVGYQLTSVKQDHISTNRINQPVPTIDYSQKSEYWLTVYIEPKVGEDGPPFYNWDYKVNDFGKIKLE